MTICQLQLLATRRTTTSMSTLDNSAALLQMRTQKAMLQSMIKSSQATLMT